MCDGGGAENRLARQFPGPGLRWDGWDLCSSAPGRAGKRRGRPEPRPGKQSPTGPLLTCCGPEQGTAAMRRLWRWCPPARQDTGCGRAFPPRSTYSEDQRSARFPPLNHDLCFAVEKPKKGDIFRSRDGFCFPSQFFLNLFDFVHSKRYQFF